MKNAKFKVLWASCYVLLVGIIALMPVYYEFSHAVEAGFIFGIPLLEVTLHNLQQYISLFFARKALVIVIFSTIIVLLGGFLLNHWIHEQSELKPEMIVPAIQFFVQGGIVGIALRQLLLALSLNNLFGKSVEIQRLFFLFGVAILVWLFPVGARHGAFAGFYVLGIAGGLLIHFILRRLFIKSVRAGRYGKNILEMINTRAEPLNATEEKAVKHFTRENWRLLERFFHKIDEEELSTRLKLLEACMYRVQGRYARALRVIDKELENAGRNTLFDNHLLLQKALVHGELFDDAQMHEALRKASQIEPENFLLKITRSLRLAEDIPLLATAAATNIDRQLPLTLIREAIYLNDNEEKTAQLSDLLGHTVQYRWGLIQDAYGYALLKSGDYLFSRELFLNCIEKEPGFSSSYLHLGEWYISLYINEKTKKAKNIRLANLCFNIAVKLERSKESRIARRAKNFIKTYSKLTNIDDTE